MWKGLFLIGDWRYGLRMLNLARNLLDVLPVALLSKASEMFPEAFQPKPGDYVWQATKPPVWPRKTIHGRVVRGYRTVWRRRRESDGVWEFQEEDISMDEWCENHF